VSLSSSHDERFFVRQGEMLDLSYHLIGDKGMLAVGKVLQTWVALTTLVLKGNGIRDEAALVLAASLRGRKLPKIACIDLSDNQVRIFVWSTLIPQLVLHAANHDSHCCSDIGRRR
jgi:Ran GTPase-activating protein (RanGAP) involved in mRNA processing and transport